MLKSVWCKCFCAVLLLQKTAQCGCAHSKALPPLSTDENGATAADDRGEITFFVVIYVIFLTDIQCTGNSVTLFDKDAARDRRSAQRRQSCLRTRTRRCNAHTARV